MMRLVHEFCLGRIVPGEMYLLAWRCIAIYSSIISDNVLLFSNVLLQSHEFLMLGTIDSLM